jgi:hypothetical protein
MVCKMVAIGTLAFASQKAATAHFQEILRRYGTGYLGEIIPEPAATELRWLLERHPQAEERIGCGVAFFTTQVNSAPGWRDTVGFAAVRADGSRAHFSYHDCIRAPTPMAGALQAMRAEVEPDILDKRQEYFDTYGDAERRIPCRLSGELVTFEQTEAHHASPWPFIVMAKAWLGAKRIVPDEDFVGYAGGDQLGPRVRDAALAAEWREFHHQHAVISIVSRDAHRREAPKSRTRKADRQLDLGALLPTTNKAVT